MPATQEGCQFTPTATSRMEDVGSMKWRAITTLCMIPSILLYLQCLWCGGPGSEATRLLPSGPPPAFLSTLIKLIYAQARRSSIHHLLFSMLSIVAVKRNCCSGAAPLGAPAALHAGSSSMELETDEAQVLEHPGSIRRMLSAVAMQI